ncbi:M16 family metallopeptidase [Haloimpatiens lingqiaonensis]|uniref:M16 family metallopeptidase n=1 Tax=Haloimpatiens lingqiaonensis TaxID=1380675 RepID=UPI0010FD5F1B|nr:pitrilysin family protein [Haloimpatiens lingqiaonensis]
MYKLIKLDNGLRIVLEHIPYVSSVSVGVFVQTGSRNENKHNNGISHFIEHMLFKGTNKRAGKEIAETIENVGGQINAFTSKEMTCFYTKSLNTHLDLSLDVLSDILLNSKLADEDIEKEKNVIYEEINMSEDSPEDVLMDLHSIAIWGEDSLSLPILGTKESLKGFNREILKEYMGKYYIPDNSVISICGNFNVTTIESLVDKYFGHWNVNENSKVLTNYSSPLILKDNLYRKKEIEQLHISLGIPGIEMGNDSIYPLLILTNILGGGASSILFQKLREEMSICYSVYCGLSSMKNTGIINIYLGLNTAVAAKAINAIKEQMSIFTKKGINEVQLYNGKEQLKGSYILGLESTSSRMFSNGKSALFLNKIKTPEEILNKIDKISMEHVNEVMEHTFKQGIVNSSFVGDISNIDEIISHL